jgi:hypothetical protein
MGSNENHREKPCHSQSNAGPEKPPGMTAWQIVDPFPDSKAWLHQWRESGKDVGLQKGGLRHVGEIKSKEEPSP